jgi:hypothetical protein
MSATRPTFGEIRLQCEKSFPAVDPDIRDSYINERYRRILRRGDWQRLRVQAVIQTVAPYETGTVAATQGSASITGTDTVWTEGMNGRAIRIAEGDEYYQFTYVSPTSGTLDRVYEGADATAATHSIFQNVYVLPSDLHVLHSIRVLGSVKDLDQVSQEELDEREANRATVGTPDCYAPHMDDTSTPPRAQIEVYPVPDSVMALPFWYTQDPTLFSASQTASFIAPWLNPDALYCGVEADVRRRLEKDYVGAQAAESMFTLHLSEMFAAEARRIAPRQIKMADRFTRHNVRRWTR